MPRVHFVKKARKDNPVAKAGEPYYWWKFRFGGKHYSRTPPRQSQLTQSAYFSTIYSIQEQIEDASPENAEEFESMVDDFRSQVSDLKDETQSSFNNMPESLQYSPTGELLQERIDALDNAEMEMDIDSFDFEEEEFMDDEPERDEFDDDEDGEIEYNDAVDEWESARDLHEQEQEDNRRTEFEQWLDEQKSTLSDALDQAII